ncbi:MAG: hypothetical protein NTW86_21625 [Candidatus Sumerlaeota bacterium]|nr:hypothetical protein [Candidatus Sumerlaeota bacterium]
MNPSSENASVSIFIRSGWAGRLSKAAGVTAAMAVLFCPAVPVCAVLRINQTAPAFALSDAAGRTVRFDEGNTTPTLLFFAKPGDTHTSETLSALRHMWGEEPELARGLTRYLLVSHVGADGQVRAIETMAGKDWRVLLDPNDRAYRDYLIIATPTLVLVGKSRRIEAAYAGYDLGLEDRLRRELARVLGVGLPPAARGEAPKADMSFQLGRRLFERGLWDHALPYYLKAKEEGPLTPQERCELAEIYIEINQPSEAIAILAPLEADKQVGERATLLLERARKTRVPATATPTPPKVAR